MKNNLVRFIFNKEIEVVQENTLLTEIINRKKYKSVVVWVNGDKLTNNEKNNYIIKENDEIKVMRILGGG